MRIALTAMAPQLRPMQGEAGLGDAGKNTDPALMAAVAPLEQEVGRETHRLTVEALGADERTDGVRELVQATLDLVRGLGLANAITDDARRRGRILAQWARTLDSALEGAR